jgi:hypothetical protein
MTLKIERISGKRRTRIRLSGELRSEHLDQVKAEIERGGPRVDLDLQSTIYRKIEVLRPREFSEVKKPLLDHGPNHVRIRVEACGVCHSDSGTVGGLFPIDWPRVPGHEVVGRIDALGSGVQGWTVGQRPLREHRQPRALRRLVGASQSLELSPEHRTHFEQLL